MSWGTHVVLAAEEFVEQRGRALRGEPGRQCAQARGSLDAMEVVVAGAAGLQQQGGHALLDVVLRPAGDLTKVVDAQTVLLVVQRPGRALGQRGSADWLLNTADNTFGPVGDFDGDGHAEILVSSPWGIGVLKLSGGTMTVPMMAPNGTRFGGWLLNTADNDLDVGA